MILSGQPLFGGQFQPAHAVPSALTLPGAHVVLNNFAVPHPNLSPLNPVGHKVVTVTTKDDLQGVFKLVSGVDWLQVIIDFSREFDGTEQIIVLRGANGFKLINNFIR